MYGPWGIKTHNSGPPGIKATIYALLVLAFPILSALLFLWVFGRI